MTDRDQIDRYIKALSKALRGIPTAEVEDIIAEIGAHLDHRAGEGKLETALAELGSPAVCARAFRDELLLQTAFNDGGPARTFGALLALGTRRLIAAVGLLFASFFLILSIAMAVSAIAEIFSPETVGLWVGSGGGSFVFGTVNNLPGETYTEVLGRWYFPAAGMLAVLLVLLYLISHLTARGFLKLMVGRRQILGFGV